MSFTLTTEHFSMDYCKYGNGERAFVLIPGLSTGTLAPMEPLYAAEYASFTDEFTVYVFDRKKELPESYSIEEMAEDTVTAIKQLGLKSISLQGSSQGGMIAQLIAERHPELVEKLAIVSSSSRPDALGGGVVRNWIDLAKKGDGKALNTDAIYKVYSPGYINKYYDLMQSVMVQMSEEALKRFITLAEPILAFDHYEDLADIQCPVLVIGCEGDRVFSEQPSRDMAEKIGCELIVFGNEYGHAVYDENPECIQRVLDFVTEKKR